MQKNITISHLVNRQSISVFTDASYHVESKTACSGALIVLPDFTVRYYDAIVCDTSVYRAELIAMREGLKAALRYRAKNINIFSDSLLSVNSVRKWIFSWVNKKNKEGLMVNSNNEPVANSDLIEEIVTIIMENSNRNINIFHQHGHIKNKNTKKVLDGFSKANDGYRINSSVLNMIKTFNDIVDHNTRANLTISVDLQRRGIPHKNIFIESRLDKKEVLNKYNYISKINL